MSSSLLNKFSFRLVAKVDKFVLLSKNDTFVGKGYLLCCCPRMIRLLDSCVLTINLVDYSIKGDI